MGFSASDMDGGNVSCEIITGGEHLCALFPFADVSTRAIVRGWIGGVRRLTDGVGDVVGV